MDIVLVLLRLIHIVSGVAWVGLGAVTVFYIAPAAATAGESGLRFLKTLLTQSAYARAFPMFAGLTMLAGLLLYALGAHTHFTQLGNMVLGIGALAGIAAGIHGGATTGRATTALGEALVQHVPDGAQSIPASAVATLNDLSAKLQSHSRVSLVLMIIALLGMGSARYL